MYCGHGSLSLYKENHDFCHAYGRAGHKSYKINSNMSFSDEFGYKLAKKPLIFCFLEHAHVKTLGFG